MAVIDILVRRGASPDRSRTPHPASHRSTSSCRGSAPVRRRRHVAGSSASRSCARARRSHRASSRPTSTSALTGAAVPKASIASPIAIASVSAACTGTAPALEHPGGGAKSDFDVATREVRTVAVRAPRWRIAHREHVAARRVTHVTDNTVDANAWYACMPAKTVFALNSPVAVVRVLECGGHGARSAPNSGPRGQRFPRSSRHSLRTPSLASVCTVIWPKCRCERMWKGRHVD